ncbi:MAG: GreA/GreB family elongation factor [Candidatus Shikimatogenerans bostrichidophilus]|nr:MAG: GreA/GreB family elongation factor [Candidatus Shikimatogenerans bostrichidophilus]
MEYINKKYLKKIKKKLLKLENIKKKKIKKINEALERGDLSENNEYNIAKEEYELLLIKINNFKKKISNINILDNSIIKKKKNKIQLYSKVKIKNLKNNKINNYKIVSDIEANIKKNKISINSPLFKRLIGKKKGDKVIIKIFKKKIKYLILNIK